MEAFYATLLHKVASDTDIIMCDSNHAWTGQTEGYLPKIKAKTKTNQTRAKEIYM